MPSSRMNTRDPGRLSAVWLRPNGLLNPRCRRHHAQGRVTATPIRRLRHSPKALKAFRPTFRDKPLQLLRAHLLKLVKRRRRPELHTFRRLPVRLVDPRDKRLRRRKIPRRAGIQETLDRPRHLLRLRNQHLGDDRTGSELLESEDPRGAVRDCSKRSVRVRPATDTRTDEAFNQPAESRLRLRTPVRVRG
jgi:hypothetical protein